MAGRPSLFSPAQWDTIKAAYIAGTNQADIVAAFPGLSGGAIRKAASRGSWPTPSRLIHEARKAQHAANSHYQSSQRVPNLSRSGRDSQNQQIDALSLTIESTKGVANASLANLAVRTAKKVDNWDIPDPRDIKEGLSLANFLMRLHQPAPQHLSQVNVQVVSPWGTASGAKFLEVEGTEEAP